jgi:hypothetical protein
MPYITFSVAVNCEVTLNNFEFMYRTPRDVLLRIGKSFIATFASGTYDISTELVH